VICVANYPVKQRVTKNPRNNDYQPLRNTPQEGGNQTGHAMTLPETLQVERADIRLRRLESTPWCTAETPLR
jgi:hypothetical protein